jgi:hypothetical protein
MDERLCITLKGFESFEVYPKSLTSRWVTYTEYRSFLQSSTLKMSGVSIKRNDPGVLKQGENRCLNEGYYAKEVAERKTGTDETEGTKREQEK